VAATLKINGLDELRKALLDLPLSLSAAAVPIVHGAAQATFRDISARYPTGGTGNLKQHLQIELRGTDGVSAGARVWNTAKHAYLYERGSGKRHWFNGKNTGTMPAANLFIPIAVAHRHAMHRDLTDLVEQAGLTVSGSTV